MARTNSRTPHATASSSSRWPTSSAHVEERDGSPVIVTDEPIRGAAASRFRVACRPVLVFVHRDSETAWVGAIARASPAESSVSSTARIRAASRTLIPSESAARAIAVNARSANGSLSRAGPPGSGHSPRRSVDTRGPCCDSVFAIAMVETSSTQKSRDALQASSAMLAVLRMMAV